MRSRPDLTTSGFSSRWSWIGERPVVWFILVSAAYFLAAEAGHFLSFPGEMATFWMPAGISVACLLATPKRLWWAVYLATLTANLASDTLLHEKSLLVSCGFWIANAVEFTLASAFLAALGSTVGGLQSVRTVLVFLSLCCLVATAVGATIGATVLTTAFDGNFAEYLVVWWSGDAAGMAVMFPLATLVTSGDAMKWERSPIRSNQVLGKQNAYFDWMVLVVLLAATAAVADFIFGRQQERLAYLTYPILLWLVIQYGRHGAAFGLFLLAIIVAYHTSRGHGLFGSITEITSRASVLQIYLIVSCTTFLTLASVVFQQRHAENQLMIANAEFQMVYQAMPVAMVQANTDRIITDVNPAFGQVFGYRDQEVLGKSTAILYADEKRFADAGKSHFAANAPQSLTPFQTEFLHRDGHVFVGETIGTAIHDELGHHVGNLGLILDVSDRLAAEENARKAQERLSIAVMGGEVGLWDWDCQTDELVCSDIYHRQLGEPAGTITQLKQFSERVHENDLARTLAFVKQAIEGNGEYESMFRMRHRDQRFRWILSRGFCYRNAEGKATRFVGSHVDVTDLQQARADLDLLRTIDGSWLWDLETDSMDYSPALRNLLGFAETDLDRFPESRRAIERQLHPTRGKSFWKELRDSISEEGSYESAVQIALSNGQYEWFFVRAAAAYDEQDRPVRVAGYFRNVHGQKLAELSLRESNADLEQFAYAVSHDLQEPLRAIGGFSQLIERNYAEKLDEKGIGYLNRVTDGVSRMSAMIRQLLEYSRVGRREHDCELVDLNLCVADAIESLSATIGETSAKIEVGDLPTAFANRQTMTQVFQNLIGNAIKFRRSGQAPRIQISSDTSQTTHRIHVQDNGIGIEKQYQDQVFGLFKRLHRRDEVAGTGLGLAICRRIIDRHRGEITVDSSKRSGSTFTFSLPAHSDPSPPEF